MKISSSNPEICAVIAFRHQDSFGRNTVSLLAKYGIEYLPVQSVYEAASMLAKDEGIKKLIIIGTVKELGIEGGRFFEICRNKENAQCICYVPGGSRSDKKIFNKAVSCGAMAVGGEEELEDVLQALMEKDDDVEKITQSGQGKDGDTKKEIQITAEELEALLGDD